MVTFLFVIYALVSPLYRTIEAYLSTKASVNYVIDGDTIEINNGQRVRYLGINTPEIAHPPKRAECFGNEAFEENKKLVLGKRVRLERDSRDKDDYGRLLRYVYLDSQPHTFINEYLLKNGFAKNMSIPPNIRFNSKFKKDAQKAKLNKKGLWKACKNIT